MGKSYKIKISTIVWVVLGILFLVWLFWPTDYSTDNYNYNGVYDNSEPEIIEEESLNQVKPNAYDTWYYPHLPINYYFTKENVSHEDCDNRRKARVIEAFRIIEQKTNETLKFTNDNSFKEGIKIICSSYKQTELAVAEGGFSYYQGSKEILEGELIIYRPDYTYFDNSCTYPDNEIHEIIHAFGFDHIENRVSILNSVKNTNVRKSCIFLDDEIANCLVYIYSDDKIGHTCEGIPFIEE